MADFMRKGITKWKWVPTIAAANNADGSPGNPTRVEITAGTDLTPKIEGFDGWNMTNAKIETNDQTSTAQTSIPGIDQLGDPTLTFREDDTTNTMRTLLAKGTSGFIFIAPTGDTNPKPTEIWAVQVSGNNRMFDAGAAAAQYQVTFTVPRRPNQNGVAPV